MADANEQIEEALEDDDTLEDIDGEGSDDTDYKALAAKNAGIAKRALTKLKKANEKPKEEPKVVKPESKTQPEGLDETQLDYLDLKGITDDEDIKIIERHVQRTGETVRQALKDDYVIKKLESLKEQREVKDATPSSTKRTGQTTGTLDQDIAKFERDGTLPDDYKRRTEVVNAVVDKKNGNKPNWG